MKKNQDGSQISSSRNKNKNKNKRTRSPSDTWSDGEISLSDPQYLESDYDSWSIHTDNSTQTHPHASHGDSSTGPLSRPPAKTRSLPISPISAISLISPPISPAGPPQARKIRTPRKEMKDIDGFLRPAEIAYEINHSRARCPKCMVFGKFARDSSAGSRRYKCRTPACNKTMGCKEFYMRYRTRYREMPPFVEEDHEPEQMDDQQRTKERKPATEQVRLKDQKMADQEGKQVEEEYVAHMYKIAKLQTHAAQMSAPKTMFNLEGCSARSSGADSAISIGTGTGTGASSTSHQLSAPRQWSDPSGYFRKRVIGPAHPANMGISILREGARDYRHDATRVESRDNNVSLETRVKLLGIAPHLAKAAMRTLESLRPKPVVPAADMCLVYVDMQYPGASEIRSKLRSLGFDTDRIYTISKAWDAVEFLVSNDYETEFVNKCKVCRLDIVDKEAMFPRSAAGVAALRKRFGGLIKQNKNPRVQEFFQTRLKELAQWVFDAKQHARIGNETGNKVIDLQYLNVRAMSETKFRSILAMIKPASIIFCSETWSVNEQSRLTHPNVIGCSIQAFRARGFRSRDGIMAFAHADLMHAIKIIKRSQYILTITIDETVICGIYFPPSLSIEDLRKELQKMPVNADIVLGDFNVTFGRVIDKCKAKEERQSLLATFAGTRGLTRVDPISITCKHYGLDHVFATDNRKISNLTLTDAPFKTDHPLLTMQATLNSHLSTDSSSQRFRTSRLKKKQTSRLFCTAFDNMMNGICSRVTQTSSGQKPDTVAIEMLDMTLTAVMQCALEMTVGCYHPDSSKPQRSTLRAKGDTLAEIMRAIKSSKREYGRTTPLRAKDPHLTPMQEAEQYYTSLFSTATVVATDMVTAPTPATAPAPAPAPATATATQSTSTTQIVSEDIQSGVHNRTLSPPVRTIKGQNRLPSVPHIVITDEQLSLAIKDYPGDKAPGVDGLDRRVLMCLLESKNFITLLARLFRWCIACEHTPARWNTSLIHPIPKPGKDADFIANRRPVALTAILRRIFEKILLPHISGNEAYDKGQGGFRRGFSCITMILLSEQGRKTGLAHRIYLDLESAYDRVNIPKLLAKLAKNNISDKIIALVKSLFTDGSSIIAVNGALSKAIPKTNGLFQGSLLSPALFNWYINDLTWQRPSTAGQPRGFHTPFYSQMTSCYRPEASNTDSKCSTTRRHGAWQTTWP